MVEAGNISGATGKVRALEEGCDLLLPVHEKAHRVEVSGKGWSCRGLEVRGLVRKLKVPTRPPSPQRVVTSTGDSSSGRITWG